MASLKNTFLAAQVFLIAMAGSTTALSVRHSGLQPVERHDLPIGPETVRVEFSAVFLDVIQTGDRKNNTGELRRVMVTLRGPSEEMQSIAVGQQLSTDAPRRGNDTYLEIRPTDRVQKLGRFRAWINADRGARVTLEILADELDCRGENICRRGNTGRTTLSFNLPSLPDTLPETCSPETRINYRRAYASGPGTLSPVNVETGAGGSPRLVFRDFEMCFGLPET